MSQLNLFNAEELYKFPKGLLEYKENFHSREEADLLKGKLHKTATWEQRTQKTYDKMVLSVSETGYQLGFTNLSYFGRLFE
ncbi:hypothetical protein ABEG63_14920 [Chryseobacterium sp. C39-AII1]|uniref:hypothetical protein n=1 Tax=Chryseobacterium sp. C39-AII1 TaxID=3080332 RepID=UPI00320B7E0F